MAAPTVKITKSLHDAIRENKKEIVNDILNKNESIAKEICSVEMAKDGTPLHLCSRLGRTECLRLILETGVDVNKQCSDGLIVSGSTAMHEAVENEQLEIIDVLSEYKADLDRQESGGQTPLHKACQRNKTQLVRKMVELGANVNIRDHRGQTPLQMSILRGPDDMTECLLEHKADIHVLDKEGQSPLHYASEWGNKKIIDALIKAGADVNLQDNEGQTPAHVGDDVETVEYLGQLGADLKVRDKKGRPAVEEELDMDKQEYKDINNALKKHADIMANRKPNPIFDYETKSKFKPPTAMVDKDLVAAKSALMQQIMKVGGDTEEDESSDLKPNPIFDYETKSKFKPPTAMVDKDLVVAKSALMQQIMKVGGDTEEDESSETHRSSPLKAVGVLDELKAKTERK